MLLIEPELVGEQGSRWFLRPVTVDKEQKFNSLIMTRSMRPSLTFQADVAQRSLLGSYVQLCLGYSDKSDQAQCEQALMAAANLLRLRFSPAAALELAASFEWDLLKNLPSQRTEGPLVQFSGNGKEGYQFFEEGLESGLQKQGGISLKSEASILLDESFRAIDHRHQFLFLWMALEAQLGDGSARSQFCKKELQSTILSEEMRRLHQVRSDFAHGKGGGVAASDITSLLQFMRIAAILPGAPRNKLVALLETKLTSA
ncbi:hypothetical protein [uncultured Agrobacterium sp.]|nr:hypothetical protein [uncultured Agrobacterium sp.]